MVIFALVLNSTSSQSSPNSLMLHVETGEKIIIFNGCQGSLAMDSTGWFSPTHQGGLSLPGSLGYFTTWGRWWHNLVLVFYLIKDIALLLFILETSLQRRKKSCPTEKESQHSIPSRGGDSRKEPKQACNRDICLCPPRLSLSYPGGSHEEVAGSRGPFDSLVDLPCKFFTHIFLTTL